MKYLAIINTPGYLPDTEPVEFETIKDAWWYLYHEYVELELDAMEADISNCQVCGGTVPANGHGFNGICDDDSDTATELGERAHAKTPQIGTVYGPTPRLYNSEHDLGLALSVELAE